MNLPAFRVILCRPKHAANIGAVARVAGNFGVSEITVVAPEDPHWRANSEAQKLAVAHAAGIFASIRETATLPEALEGCTRAVALTRRPGRNRLKDRYFHEAWAAPGRAPLEGQIPWPAGDQKIALVFGNETTGLLDSEILHCRHAFEFRTAPELGSLNLSHAVAVALSRLLELAPETAPRLAPPPLDEERPSTVDERESLYDHWRRLLVAIGLTKAGNPDKMLRLIRGILEPRELRDIDVRVLHAFLAKVERALERAGKN